MATRRADGVGAGRRCERSASSRPSIRKRTRPPWSPRRPSGVTGYEWSPDGKFVAYLSRDAASGPPPIANKVGSNPPATRLWVQPLPVRHAARAHAAGSIRRQLLLVAGQQRDRVFVRAVRRASSRPTRRRSFAVADRRRRDASDHRSPGHERVAAVLAGWQAAVLHHHQRAHRHHCAARPGGGRCRLRRTRTSARTR